MAATKQILTSVHGRRLGISRDGRLVIGGRTALTQDDSGRERRVQGAPGTLNTTGTLTAALISTGIVTSTTAAAVTATVDTGTAMDTALAAEHSVNDAFDWSATATGANAFTVTAASGHTLVGSGIVSSGASGSFRSRRTAANTWVTYRLS